MLFYFNSNLSLDYSGTSYSGEKNINSFLQALMYEVFPLKYYILTDGVASDGISFTNVGTGGTLTFEENSLCCTPQNTWLAWPLAFSSIPFDLTKYTKLCVTMRSSVAVTSPNAEWANGVFIGDSNNVQTASWSSNGPTYNWYNGDYVDGHVCARTTDYKDYYIDLTEIAGSKYIAFMGGWQQGTGYQNIYVKNIWLE